MWRGKGAAVKECRVGQGKQRQRAQADGPKGRVEGSSSWLYHDQAGQFSIFVLMFNSVESYLLSTVTASTFTSSL